MRIRKESRLQNDKVHSDQKPEQIKQDDYYAAEQVANEPSTESQSLNMWNSLAIAYSMNQGLSKLHVAETPMATRPIGHVPPTLYPHGFPAWADSGTTSRLVDLHAYHQVQYSEPAPVLLNPESLVRKRAPGSLLAADWADRSARHHEGWQDRSQTVASDYYSTQHFVSMDLHDMPVSIRGSSNYVSPANILCPTQSASAAERTMPVNDDLRLPPILLEDL